LGVRISLYVVYIYIYMCIYIYTQRGIINNNLLQYLIQFHSKEYDYGYYLSNFKVTIVVYMQHI